MGRNGVAEMAQCRKGAKRVITKALCQCDVEHYDNNNPPQHYTDMVNLSCAISARAISSRAISAAPFRPRHFGVDPLKIELF